VRCFVAAELSEPFLELCDGARERILDVDPAWRSEKWVPAENLHVTLAFLGEVDEAQMAGVVEGLHYLRVAPFDLVAPSLVPVPNHRRASMCWLEFGDPDHDAAALAAQIAQIAEGCGVPVDVTQRFRPHVTLVRSRHGRRLAKSAATAFQETVTELGPGSMSVSSVTVFTSTLARTGPVYTAAARIALTPS